MIGGAREAAHRDIERRGRGAGNGRVDSEIDSFGVLDRAGRGGGRFDVVASQGGGIL